MRPLDRSAAASVLVNYSPPITLGLAGVGVAAVRVFQTTTPAVVDCLALWDLEADGRMLSTDETVVLAAIKRAVDGKYRTAAISLLEAFGRHCAYCESPISEQVQVEHLLPKSQYPTFALDIQNFLIACGPCNRKKSVQPLRSLATGWISHTTTPGPADFHAAVRGDHYCWPDTRPTPTWLPLVFEYRDANGWHAVTPQVAAADTYVVSTSSRYARPVRADIGTIGVHDVEVRVRVCADPAAIPPRGQETVDMCALNTVSAGTNDDRVGHRTRTWLDAVTLWNEEVPDPSNPPAELSTPFVAAAGASGCFSVWYTTGELLAPGSANSSPLLRPTGSHPPTAPGCLNGT